MAINFKQVIDRIGEIGLGARERRESLDRLRARAWEMLHDWADKGDLLGQKLEQARQVDASLRCAIPRAAPLNAAFDSKSPPNDLTLVAADGSQIAPDRHAAVLYSLVNVGAIVMQVGSNQAPSIHTDSRLLVDDEIYTPGGMLTLEAIEQQRDLAERRKLLELVKNIPGVVIALTDGPLELWGAKGSGQDEYRKNLQIHLSTLSQLQEHGTLVAGYVDKPGADLVIRLLEMTMLSSGEQLKEIRTQHPLRGVTDRWLFGRLLQPGQRSAIFGLQSGSRLHYTGELAIHFFYINVGSQNHPSLVRVEVPKWVADDSDNLDRLHAVLLDQCRIMGARPYPYILHRAHEIAVVKFDEKAQVEGMLALELRRSGGELDEQSAKSSAKELPGRGRK